MSFPSRGDAAVRSRVRPRRSRLTTFERLERRLALSAASTTPAGPTVGQTLAAVVDTTTLGGIQISGQTSSFATSPSYLLLTQPGQLNAPYALVSYGATTPQAFTTLSLAAGDGTQAFSQSTIVAQAASSHSSNTSPIAFESLSKAKTNSLSVVAAGDFTGTGFIYILGAGGNGVFSYNKLTSTLPTSTAAGTFRGLLAVGATGMSGSPHKFGEISVQPGSAVFESSAPSPGSSIVPSSITITRPTNAKPTFVLPIIGGQYGFAKPTASRPGSVIVGTGASSFIVNYTGITPNGLALTGCTTTYIGTVPMNTPVNATANAPVSFTFQNNSGQGVGVYAAIAGQQSDAQGNLTYGYLMPRQKAGVNDFTRPLQFVSMASGSPPDKVPTFQLFAAAAKPGATMSFKVDNKPTARMVSTRVVFGMGQPPVISILSNKPSFPAMSNPSDPNNRINFDFVEFTMRNSSPNDGTLFINTTQVDQVGLPFLMNITPRDTSGAVNGVGVQQNRAGLAAGYAKFISSQFQGSGDSSISQAAEDAFQGLLTPYRLLNPSDAITNPPERYTSVPKLDGYFDAALATFFSTYTGGGFRLKRDGYFFVGTTETGYRPAAAQYSATLTAGSTVNVTNAAATGTQITYSASNSFQRGQTVSIVGLQPAGFNLANQTIVSATPTSFTIDNGLQTQPSTSGGSATGLPMLSFPAVTGPTAGPAAVNLAAGLLVAGPGITDTAVVTTQPVIDGSNVTHVSLAGDITNGSGSYSFTSPGEFTVLKLRQADDDWNVIAGGQTYQIYAPYFAPMGGTGGATAFPTGLPVGSGIGSLSLTSGGADYALNTVGQLTFSGGGGSNAAGFYVTDGTGKITAIGLTNPGSGYTSMPTIGFSGTSSKPAVVTASPLPAAPSWVAPGGPSTVQSPGLMTFGCLGVFADGGQQALAGQVSSGILQLSLTSGGGGYASNASGQLTFTGGGGSNAAGSYTTNAQGVITEVQLTHPGSGYTSMPTIGFSGTSTTPAVVTAFTATGQTLSDIQNTIVSAFNRGVANQVTVGIPVNSVWDTASNFYPRPVAPAHGQTTGVNWSNLYSAYLHNPTVSVPRPGSQVGLAYGFAYDDQGNNSTTLATPFPQGVSIKLKPWSVQRFAAAPLAFTALPTVKAGALSATLKGLANKQYNWQLFQVPNPASGQWTPVPSQQGGRGAARVSANGIVAVNGSVSAAGTYTLVVWAANVRANDSGPTTAAALQFGGQYSASPRFTVTSQQLQAARPLAARGAFRSAMIAR